MTTEYGPDQLKEARERLVRELGKSDPSWTASRSGTSYSFREKAFTVPFFGEDLFVSYPSGKVTRAVGRPVNDTEEVVVLHYLVGAGGTPVEEKWISYRDLPGARYHESSYVAEVEGPLSRGLAGHLERLRGWAQRNARVLGLPGDVSMAWEVLPRVPLLVIFNEADEEFPASARVLFDVSASAYLPTEVLSTLAEMAVERLLTEVMP